MEQLIYFEEYCRENNLIQWKSRRKDSIKEEWMRICGVISDDILKTLKAIFADVKNLKFTPLGKGNEFQNLDCQFDKDAVESLKKNYENIFDVLRQKADLTGTMHKCFVNKHANHSPNFIFENEVAQTLAEAVKLL